VNGDNLTIPSDYNSEVSFLVRVDQTKNISQSRRDVVEVISEPLGIVPRTIKLYNFHSPTHIRNETIGIYQFNNVALSGSMRFDSVVQSLPFHRTIPPTYHIRSLIPSSFPMPQGAEVLSLKNESKSSSSSFSIFASATAGPD